MNYQDLNNWRVIPRLMVLASFTLAGTTASWIFSMDAPTVEQMGFASTVLLAVMGYWSSYNNTGGSR